MTDTTQLDLFPKFISERGIKPVLITTTELSKTALEFAAVLGIRIDKVPMVKSYPCIKCNINSQSTERIYHLPFDQQYDKTVITPNNQECWVTSVQEAENLGFRRAWRWKQAE